MILKGVTREEVGRKEGQVNSGQAIPLNLHICP